MFQQNKKFYVLDLKNSGERRKQIDEKHEKFGIKELFDQSVFVVVVFFVFCFIQ